MKDDCGLWRTHSCVPITVFCVLTWGLLTGCGSVGDPLYPALKIPNRASDLAAVERGDRIFITFTIPPQTTEGLALTAIGQVDLRAGPNPGPGFDFNIWANSAEKIDIPPPAAPGPVRSQIAAQPFVGKDVIIGVRIANSNGRFSEWSNLVTLTVEPPLATPANLKAESAPQGVQLNWTASGAAQFRIYRKTGDQTTPTLLASSDQPSYVDPTAEFGKTYQYYVEALHDKAVSEVAGPVAIAPKDVFPPAVPAGLAASAGVGSVELAWERNTEPDFKEYRVFRAEGDGPFTQIAASLDVPSYSDHAVESGKRYRYQLIAVDQNGNVSAPTSPVEVTVP
ncbi:MAG TPA: hypothetical protein VKX49_21310 [Bryobacteraceae bacterium]|nr:hypothetical protein [Bryobacteraceae bacterium]